MKKHIAITAHSGCEGTPDNSIASVLAGIASGADTVEVDVRLDPNGVLRLTHDIPENFADAVTLEEAFQAVIGTDTAINCDLKHYEALYPTIALADQYALARDQFVFSGSVDVKMLLADPQISRRARIFLNSEEIAIHLLGSRPASRTEEMRLFAEDPAAIAELMKKAGAEALNAPFEHVPSALITSLRAAGIELSLWTANTDEDISRLLGEDLLSLTTRRPAAAVRLREKLLSRNSGQKNTSVKPVFRHMENAEFEQIAPVLFDILAGNMEKIAPTGCSREEDFALWHSSMLDLLQDGSRRIALCFAGEPERIAGYFQYTAKDGVFMMEEIEIAPEYQGKSGIFRGLYSLVLPSVSGMQTAEAYANKANARSIGILRKLGLQIIGENKSGRSWHFRGLFSDLIRWHEGR